MSAVCSTRGPHSGPWTFFCSIFTGFSLLCLLTTTILDSFSLFYLPNNSKTGGRWRGNDKTVTKPHMTLDGSEGKRVKDKSQDIDGGTQPGSPDWGESAWQPTYDTEGMGLTSRASKILTGANRWIRRGEFRWGHLVKGKIFFLRHNTKNYL